MSNVKKLTQTTLPFFIKSKNSGTTPIPPTLSANKRPRTATDIKEEPQKKVNVKRSLIPTTQDAAKPSSGEPEVSSSSEQVEPAAVSQSVSKPKHNLEPFLVLKRCDTPKIEVSSSTSSDEVLLCEEMENVPLEKTDEEVNDAEDAIQTTAKPSDVVSAAELEGISQHNVTFDDSLPLNQSANSSILLTSPDCSITSETPKSSVKKNLSVSAKKKREQHQLVMEQKKKEREEEKERKRQQKLEEKLKKDMEMEEKKRLKAEQKEAERLAKLKEKEELQRQKEALKAEKQAELEAKNALKEEEKRRKDEEKRKKDEERQLKQEEKKKKELERVRMEEEKVRKQEAQKNALLKFFHKPSSTNTSEKSKDTVKVSSTKFKPFPVKSDMKLAPLLRVPPIDREQFDEALLQQDTGTDVYLSQLKSNGARSSPSTWPADQDEVVVMLPSHQRHRPKFIQFHTDVRPAYFGTWRKKSKHIKPRRPLGQDNDRFDYEVDSADEWEEEEPGESVDSGDEEEEEKDEYDFDPELREDGFLVDHNYLSDDEGATSDTEESLAAKKTKQMIARTYGKRSRKKSTLKPVVYGAVWEGETLSEHQERAKKMLDQFTAIVFQSVPIDFPIPVKKSSPVVSDLTRPVPDEAMPELIKAVHGCMKNSAFLVKTFQQFWLDKTSVNIAKRQLKQTIQSIARYQKKPVYRKCCWYVQEEVLAKHGLESLPVPNPAYHTATPVKVKTPAPVATPVPENGSTTPNSSQKAPNSSQKRMTDFIQPVNKRLKMDNKVETSANKETGGVVLITLGDSPCSSDPIPLSANSPAQAMDCCVSTQGEAALATTNTPTSRSGHNSHVSRRVGFTTLQNKAVSASATSSVVSTGGAKVQLSATDGVSARRVSLTTLSTSPKPKLESETETNSPLPDAKSGASPSSRRVSLTTLSTPPKPKANSKSESVSKIHSSPSSVVNQTQSPRRITLTTLSTPKSQLTSPTTKSITSSQTEKSPRRVQLTTLSKPTTMTAPAVTSQPPIATNLLTERSQNTQRMDTNDAPVKNLL